MWDQITKALLTFIGFQLLQTLFQISTVIIVAYQIDNESWYTQNYKRAAFIILYHVWLGINAFFSIYQVGVLVRQYRKTLQEHDNSFKQYAYSFLWGLLCLPLSYFYYILATFKFLYFWDRCKCCERLNHKPRRQHFLTHFSIIQFVIKDVTLFTLFLINNIMKGWTTFAIVAMSCAGVASIFGLIHILKQPWLKPVKKNQTNNNQTQNNLNREDPRTQKRIEQ